MKKVFAVSLILVMVCALSLTMLAAPGSFLDSPSNNLAPELVSGLNASDDCEAQLVITPYAERSDLPEELRTLIEYAYTMIAGTTDLSTLNSELATVAEGLGIKTTELAVSDLFDIHRTDCDNHELHGHFDVTLKAETLDNFVCLLHYHNGEWVIVEGATVTNNGTHLEFDVEDFSPFAIVVNTGTASEETPGTSDSDLITWICVAAIALVAMFVILILLGKKRKAEEE